jgi:subtilase family serine protease
MELGMKRLLSAALLAVGIGAAAASAAVAEPVEREGSVYHVAVCKRAIPDSQARCLAHVVTDSKGNVLWEPAGARSTPLGLGATDLEAAYNITTTGSSKTIVAIVDAFGYPTAEADLGMYRAQYGLPPCTTANGCFIKLNQKGRKNKFPDENVGWAVETALDLDMASAMCPSCKIMLVEADTNSFKNLAKAEDTAAAKGAHVISNSYTGGDKANITKFAESYHHPGIAITAATGDDGYQGGAFPASSPYTTAVGGTALTKNANVARGWSETAWGGAGSGCSKFAAKPAWQTDKGCKMRMMADVSAVASPATAVAI